MISKSGGQILSLLLTVWQGAPEHIKKSEHKVYSLEKIYFSLEKKP